MTDKILLGFEVGSAAPVYLPLHHLAIFGMTQLSGKTTTLEALISRSGLKAIAFIVKRGEAGFTKYNLVTPYYKPRSDWQYVEGLLNVALKEKVQYQPFMRWAILQVTKKHPETLRQVLQRSEECEKEFPRRKEVFEQLSAYLRIIVPELEQHTFSTELKLDDGINVMDLSDMQLEVQQIVIASTVEYALAELDHVIVIIPEAWESLPQGKMTPIKWVAQQFIRKGAALGNYLWLDSQDIGGIDKTPLRQCDNWILGRMKEAHEVERILKQLLGMKVPAEEIQTLPLGHFYAAIGNDVKKVYVLPLGVPEDVGREVAVGNRSPESVREEFLKVKLMGDDDLIWKQKYDELEKQYDILLQGNQALTDQNKRLTSKLETDAMLQEQTKDLKARIHELEVFNERFAKENNAFTKLKEALRELLPTSLPIENDTAKTVNLNNSEVTINLSHSERTVEMDTTKQQGQILYVAIHDLPKEGFTESELSEALNERGWPISHSSLAPQLAVNLTKAGLLIPLETKPKKYRLPSKLKINVKEAS